MNTSTSTLDESVSERGFTMVSRLAAPREMVWRAWTDPEQLHWFAGVPASPERPSTVDLPVGGAWRVWLIEGNEEARAYTTGGDLPGDRGAHRLVFSWGAVGGWPDLDPERLDEVPLVELTFHADGDGTVMVSEFTLSDNLDRDTVRAWFDLGVREGWGATIDRLAPHLTTTSERIVSTEKAATAKPAVVSAAEWEQARAELLVAEKRATRAEDAVAAQRRRLPMVRSGRTTPSPAPPAGSDLLDLFAGRSQLVLYQFMDAGPDHLCPGCTWFTHGVPAPCPGPAGRERRQLGDRLGHAARADASGLGVDELDDPVRVVARHQLLRRSRRRWWVPAQRVPSGGGRGLPDLHDHPAWGGSTRCSPTASRTSCRTGGSRTGRTLRRAGRNT